MASTPLRFPYVCGDEDMCTRDKFMDWDVHQQWSWDSQVDLPIVARQLQSWLFFGLISIYVQEDLPHRRLLKEDADGSCVIDFVEPNSCLQILFTEASSLYLRDQNGELVPEQHLEVQRALHYAMAVLDLRVIPYLNSTDVDGSTDLWTSEPHAIIFGIDLLMDLLCEQVGKFLAESVGFLRYRHRRPSLAANVNSIRNSVLRSGRCPSLAGRLRPLSQFWYQILLLPPTGMPQNHSACTKLHCVLNDVKTDKHQTKHADFCSGCSHLSADSGKLVEVIKKHSIPLIACSLDANQILQFRVVAGNLNFKYTAVSHVWTGGLGNSESNSLPSCQILRLWTMVRDLPDMQSKNIQYPGYSFSDGLEEKVLRMVEFACTALRSRGTVYFWIDTLCIPVDNEFEYFQKEAISSMAQIYAGAETVLVLDTHLQQLRAIDSTNDTFMTQLRVSPWMARSWPLQEGAVAPSLCVRLKDKTVILTRSQHKDLLSVTLHHTNSLEKTTISRNPTYAEVWNALASRGTTERSDLDGIFATLLNLNAKYILSLEKSDRMKAIISTQTWVPFSLMCIPHEKLDNETTEVSWVPEFPDTSRAMVCLDEIHGILSVVDDGFLFKKHLNSGTFGILVQELELHNKFSVEDSYDGKSYTIFPWYHGSNQGSQMLHSTSLLIFTSAPTENRFCYQGCQFEVLSQTDTGLTMKVQDPFQWQHSGMPESGNTTLRGERFEKLDDPSYKVIISEDFKDWHKPKWFRLREFPFTSIISSELDIWTYATFPASIIINSLGSYPIINSMDFDCLPRHGIYWIAYVWLRTAYALIQRAFWRFWLAQWVQQRWAATFYDSEMAQELLNAKSPTLWFMLWTYIPICVGVFVILVLSWLYPAHRTTFMWISLTVSLEPLVSLGFAKMTLMMQAFETRGCTDLLPFRWDAALLIITPGALPCLLVILRHLATGTGPNEKELRVFGCCLVYVVAAVTVNLIWITGFPGMYYSSYVNQSRAFKTKNTKLS